MVFARRPAGIDDALQSGRERRLIAGVQSGVIELRAVVIGPRHRLDALRNGNVADADLPQIRVESAEHGVEDLLREGLRAGIRIAGETAVEKRRVQHDQLEPSGQRVGRAEVAIKLRTARRGDDLRVDRVGRERRFGSAFSEEAEDHRASRPASPARERGFL